MQSCGIHLSHWSSQLVYEKEIWMDDTSQPFYKLKFSILCNA